MMPKQCGFLLLLLFVVSCTRQENQPTWNNPFDPQGTNWHPPSVVAMPDTVVSINDTISLYATGSDSSGSIVAYAWSVDSGESWDTVTDSVARFPRSWPRTSQGAREMLVRSIDNDGLASPEDTVVVLVKSWAPLVDGMDDTAVGLGDTVLITAAGSDSDGAVRRYLWSFDTSQTWHTTSEGFISRRWVLPDSGVHSARVKVQDDDSLWSLFDTIQIAVRGKRPRVDVMSDTIVAINDSMRLHASANDSDGTVAGFWWSFDRGARYQSTADSTFAEKWGLPDTGMNVVYVKVRDDDGLYSPVDSFRVMVKAYRPGITILDSLIVTDINDSVMVHASGFDSNGSVRYIWSLDDTSYRDTIAACSLRVGFSAPDTCLVAVTVIDDDGLTSAAAACTIVTLSSPPVLDWFRDTSVSVRDSVVITLAARDTEPGGRIVKYYADTAWGFSS
jgi:hypothetical protein